MKKKIVYIGAVIVIFILACSVLFNFNRKSKKEEKLTDITLAEVTHSIFYAPMYVAVEKDYFKDNGTGISESMFSLIINIYKFIFLTLFIILVIKIIIYHK